MQIQLDFFEEKNDFELIQEEVKSLRLSNEKVRKSLFARHGELAKKYIELHNRLQILESRICKDSRLINGF